MLPKFLRNTKSPSNSTMLEEENKRKKSFDRNSNKHEVVFCRFKEKQAYENLIGSSVKIQVQVITVPFEMAFATNLLWYDQIHHNISRAHNAHLHFLISPVGWTCQMFFHISPLCI